MKHFWGARFSSMAWVPQQMRLVGFWKGFCTGLPWLMLSVMARVALTFLT